MGCASLVSLASQTSPHRPGGGEWHRAAAPLVSAAAGAADRRWTGDGEGRWPFCPVLPAPHGLAPARTRTTGKPQAWDSRRTGRDPTAPDRSPERVASASAIKFPLRSPENAPHPKGAFFVCPSPRIVPLVPLVPLPSLRSVISRVRRKEF